VRASVPPDSPEYNPAKDTHHDNALVAPASNQDLEVEAAATPKAVLQTSTTDSRVRMVLEVRWGHCRKPLMRHA
jgi:hypothetical protein